MFSQIEDSFAVISANGTYYQTPLYVWNQSLFVKRGQGFIKLLPNKGTTRPKTYWQHIHCEQGRMRVSGCDLIWENITQLAAE